MASRDECDEATQVLLVGPDSLPVLLEGDGDSDGDPQASGVDISVDLLQQALHGSSSLGEGDAVAESVEEVSLDDMSGGNNDSQVVAIYQGEEGQTHTIKISLADAQTFGLHFANDSYPVTLNDTTLVGGMKVENVADHLAGEPEGVSNTIQLSNTSILQGVSCSNVATEGRIIDTEGNIVQTSEALQILPTSLSSFLEDGINQSLSIIPQYELDGTVTYAVKLKDQNEAILGTDYHVLEPDSSAKTGLDIEEELKNANLKQNILQSTETISAESIGLASSVALTNNSNSSSPAIQVPISTLEALSKQILLPASSASVPISVTLSIPTDTSVSSHSSSVSPSNNLTALNANRFYQLVTDSNSLGINHVISSDASTVPLSTLVSQPTLTVNQQHSRLINPSTAMLNVQNSPTVTLLSNSRNICHPTSRQKNLTDKLPTLLPAPKNMSSTALKTVAALKKLPLSANVVAPAVATSASVLTPAMACVAPNTNQPSLGSASINKSALSTSRISSSNSNSSKPLGSSENPIQLVQQGQTFHSMQALSQAQLRQIATVLQQKHLNSNSTATKNVLFDEQTKTRIVYRVVYPEDVDLQQPSSPTERPVSSGNQASKTAGRTRGRKGRPVRGRQAKQSSTERNVQKIDKTTPLDSEIPLASDVRKGDLKDDDVTLEETHKVEKKKILGSRTRSGRVSRPPKHMMKDFKHLHHTDYKEGDKDDSINGYSDYSDLEQPPEKIPPKEVDVSVSPAVRKRISRFSCPTCLKLYLGLGRMEKHFLQHPDHGSFEAFKQQLSASTTAEVNGNNEDALGDKELKDSFPKTNSAKGKKRSQNSSQAEKERSEMRKKKLKQALQACEISEVLEVAGPLIARYCSLWDLLLLRLVARDESVMDEGTVEESNQCHQNVMDEADKGFDTQAVNTLQRRNNNFSVESEPEIKQRLRWTSNRVQWLLMELSSLADTLKSLAGDIFQPAVIHAVGKAHIQINQKTVSEMLGVSCGVYSVNEEHLFKRAETVTADSNDTTNVDTEVSPEKRSRQTDDASEISLTLNHEVSGPEVCSEDLSSLSSLSSLMVKPVDEEDKVMLAEDMPFLNSSDDMICGGEDADLSTDSKRDQDAGVQVVDDIVNERLKNLSDNMNFAVPLQGALETSAMNGGQSGLHLLASFGGADTSITVSNSSVISNSLTENKPSISVSNMDLISSYSIPSLSPTVPGSHDVNISNSEPSNDLALEPVTSQSMLGSFGIGLTSLSTFDALQSESSNVPHSDDSFLESLSSFETPLTQSCSSSSVPVSSFGNSVMKSNAMLQLQTESPEMPRPPPKFISTFTPAITNDKTSSSISTAQRLQRSYLELDSGLDDLDFEALTQELSMNRSSNA